MEKHQDVVFGNFFGIKWFYGIEITKDESEIVANPGNGWRSKNIKEAIPELITVCEMNSVEFGRTFQKQRELFVQAIKNRPVC